MTGNRPDPGVESSDQVARDREFDCETDPQLCLTETFTDREVVLTRCLEQMNCRYKQRYLHLSICSCPEVQSH